MKIYLAGFDVFRADAMIRGGVLRAECQRNGFIGLYPMDNKLPSALEGHALAKWIYKANVELIKEADFVVANLNPFRGFEPDSGTSFEVGYAIALGKSVWGYIDNKKTLVERLTGNKPEKGKAYVDENEFTIENFDLSLNLMLGTSANIIEGDAVKCIEALARSVWGI
jgi:nucleoside 2-deoxyribosyltransferase